MHVSFGNEKSRLALDDGLRNSGMVGPNGRKPTGEPLDEGGGEALGVAGGGGHAWHRQDSGSSHPVCHGRAWTRAQELVLPKGAGCALPQAVMQGASPDQYQ